MVFFFTALRKDQDQCNILKETWPQPYPLVCEWLIVCYSKFWKNKRNKRRKMLHKLQGRKNSKPVSTNDVKTIVCDLENLKKAISMMTSQSQC